MDSSITKKNYIQVLLKENISLRFSILILLAFFLCSSIGRAQQYQLLNKSYGERAPILVHFYQYVIPESDSATIFQEIQSIEKLAKAHKDKDLLLETKLMRVHYSYHHDDSSEQQLISKLKNLSEEGRKQKSIWLEAMAENLIALSYFHKYRKYDLSFQHHLKVYELIKDLSPTKFPYKQEVLRQITEEYYHFEDYGQSIKFGIEALKAKPSHRMTVPEFPSQISILNTIGMSYQKQNDLDNAQLYYEKLLQLAKQEKSEIWEGMGYGKLGRLSLSKKQYKEAINYLKLQVAATEKHKEFDAAASALIEIGNIFLEQNNLEEANHYLLKALQYGELFENRKISYELYQSLTKLFALQGKHTKATQYLDSLVRINDSLKLEFNTLTLLKAKQDINHDKNVKIIASKRKANIIERNLLVILLSIGTLGAIAIFYILKKRTLLEIYRKHRLKKQLIHTNTQLKILENRLQTKKEVIRIHEEQVLKKKEDILLKLRGSVILTDENWITFKDLFEKLHPGYFERLFIKFPELTIAEIRFMAMSRLRLRSQEMATMLGVGTDTIRQHRSRIKKKLNLSKEHSLEEIAQHI